jgi:hypothetical protein
MFDIFKWLKGEDPIVEANPPIHYWAMDFPETDGQPQVTMYFLTREKTDMTLLPEESRDKRMFTCVAGLSFGESGYDISGNQLASGSLEHLAADLVALREQGYTNQVNRYPPSWGSVDTVTLIGPDGNPVHFIPGFAPREVSRPGKTRPLDDLDLMYLKVLMEQKEAPLY